MALVVKNLPANAGDIRDAGNRSLGQEDPLEKEMATTPVSCLENAMNRGAWRAIVHRITKSRTELKPLSTARRELVFLSSSRGLEN